MTTMSPRHERMKRRLPRIDGGNATAAGAAVPPFAPRRVKRTVIDFTSLSLPEDAQRAFADAFWNHVGSRSTTAILHWWLQLRVFDRFAAEARSIGSLADVNGDLVARYIDWLNAQTTRNGKPWSKSTRAAAYYAVRMLLHWLQRCRPGVLQSVEYPFNPFPFRNRDRLGRGRLSPQHLREILRACERDIAQTRDQRQRADEERCIARASNADPALSLGALLEYIDRHFNGLVPSQDVLRLRGNQDLYRGILRAGGSRRIEPCLYPTLETLLPYYLAIVIHTAGNPQAIGELQCDCLQPIPLLEDRELLLWEKRRSARIQRRSFRRGASFEPPSLVRDVLEWTVRLRRRAPAPLRDRLLLFKGPRGISTLLAQHLHHPLRQFEARHHLERFTLASIRPTVLTSIYRHSGDLQQARTVANHAQLSTTVRYVRAPEVEAQNRTRIAILQRAFVGHVERGTSAGGPKTPTAGSRSTPVASASSTGAAVSMFGFDCADPLAGIAPGSRAGELCDSFLGCFTCPNAIISHDPRTLARLLQARDHLKAAAGHLHPARWEAIYAIPLRILEEDILTRFSAGELSQAARLLPELAALAPLR
jgi:hypothetical protein